MCDYLKCIKIYFIYNFMEENDFKNNNQIRIKVSELVKKIPNKKNIYHFCRDNSKIINCYF